MEDQIRRDVHLFGQFVHGVGEDGFADSAQAAGSELELDGLVDDGVEGIVVDRELDSVKGKEALVLLDQGVLRLGQNAAQGDAVEGLEVGEHREAPDQLWD